MSNLEKTNNRQSFSEEKKRINELLAPVANFEMLKAAIHNGADAVYLGMPGHNARARTEDLNWSVLDEMIQYAHQHDVRVLIAFNILIFEDELLHLQDELEELVKINPDAIIVQDLGLCYLLKEMYPSLKLHGSTQMTHTNSLGIQLLNDLNLKRVVLGREVNLEEMAEIKKNTDLELEVFVHGALCVAYSGQCLTSESFGGRSANRGQCAQSCRLDYDLIVDGRKKALTGITHLVSPNDLCGLDDLPKLIEIGIDSFKIEGRYKSPEYVGLTSKMYRQKINKLTTKVDATDLEIMFSRGFYSGWLHGVHHKNLVHGKNSSHIGACIGKVKSIERHPTPHLIIETKVPVFKGDGMLIVDKNNEPTLRGKVYHVDKHNDQSIKVDFSKDVSIKKVRPGDLIYINSSDFRDQQIQLSWKDKQHHKKIPIFCHVTGKLNQALEIKLICHDLHLKVFSDVVLEQASKKALSSDDIKTELNKLGGSVYELKELNCEIDERLFLPAKALKQLRQSLIAQLDQQRLSFDLPVKQKDLNSVLEVSVPALSVLEKPVLHVLIREPEQLEELDASIVQKITLDYKHGTTYGPSIRKIKAMGCLAGIATTRILKEGHVRRLKDMEKHQPDYILVRNLGALNYLRLHEQLKHIPRIGDFSLNATNHLSAYYLLDKGLELLCPSYDLNKQQLFSLLHRSEASRFEVTVHQYMPSFHMEHCVFATFLSDGTNASNCGMVCRDHQVALRDAKDIEHPLQADQECRNTMFNGTAQSAANLVPELMQLGVQNFRIEALMESPSEIAKKLKAYRGIIDGLVSPERIKSSLGLEEKYGISEGQLLNNRVYKDRKKSL